MDEQVEVILVGVEMRKDELVVGKERIIKKWIEQQEEKETVVVVV